MANVRWKAEAECRDCGWHGYDHFEDGDIVESDHDCEDDD